MLSIVNSLIAFQQLYYKETSPEMDLKRSWYKIGFFVFSLESSKKEKTYGSKFEKSRELLVVCKYVIVLNLVE